MNKQQEPRLRFKGFTGAWEEKRLSDVVEIVGGGTPDTNNSAYWGGEIDWYSPTEIGENVYANGSIRKITLLGLQKSSAVILPADRTVLFTSRASIGDMAILTKQGATNQGFQSFIVREGLNIYFLYTMGFKIKEYALKNASGSTFLEISKTQLLQMESLFPSLTEQTHLGLFFRRLDSLIAESRAVLEKSRQLKKAMLAKMFPANGEKIPKIRFKGFEGEWERNELGCLGYCLSGIGFSENEQGGANGIPFFKVSDMNLSGNEVYLRKANNYVTQEQIDKQRWQVIQQLPCIFFAKVGAALLLNRKRLVNTPFLLDNNTMAFILDSSLDNYFMKTLFDTIDLPALAQIGALPSINAKDIEKNIVFIPTPKEQTAIGNFFRQLDETIALQSAEVEKLNQLKKGLLAAMLV